MKKHRFFFNQECVKCDNFINFNYRTLFADFVTLSKEKFVRIKVHTCHFQPPLSTEMKPSHKKFHLVSITECRSYFPT